MSGHAVYRTMLTNWAVSLAWLPLGSIAIRMIIAALREWWRKAELPVDRAGSSRDRTQRPRCGLP
jgi:hypothetical protein